jgi:hypothetical protein
MWLFTTDGFFSVVSKGCRKDQLMVRARVKVDLQRAFPGAKITTSPPPADYRFRVVVTRKAVTALLARTVEKLNYANFKDTVKDGARHEAYMRVWNAMYALQERPKLTKSAQRYVDALELDRRMVASKLDAGVQVDDLRWFGTEYDD